MYTYMYKTNHILWREKSTSISLKKWIKNIKKWHVVKRLVQ